MPSGLKIAKDGYSIEGKSDQLYVDSTTDLLKVFKNVTGSLIIDIDGNFSSEGDNEWEFYFESTTDSNYRLNIPFDNKIGYAPQFETYLDSVSLGKRRRLGNVISGISLVGDCSGFTSATNNYVTVIASVAHDITGKPVPGIYGYFVQIYYDRAQIRI